MRIYGCQFDIAWENKPENFRRVQALLHNHRLAPGSLLVLPELFATGFTMNSRAVAEDANGPTEVFLRKLAQERKVFVLGGLARSASRGQVCNEAVCFAPSGRRVTRYAKLHLFSPGDESRHYTPGKTVVLFSWRKLKVAVFICYDLRFPEIFRMAAQRGANLLVVIANWPAKRQSHWNALLRARAIESQAYAIGVNRCGSDPQHEYYGGSLVINPWGETIAEARRGETLISAQLDIATLNRRRSDFPVLRDIRTRFELQ